MAGVTTRYYNLTGGLNSLQGIGTINQTPKATETPYCYNVELHKLGGIKTMNGNKQVGNLLPATVTLGHEYTKGSKRYLMICTADGKVWQYNPITQQYSEVYQFSTATNRHSAVNYNQGVVFTNGVDDLVYYQYGRDDLQDGTVTVTDGSANVVGTNTDFTTLSKGDHISLQGLEGEYIIESVTDATHLTLTEKVEISQQQTQDYYAWELDGVTYYTTTTDNNSSNVTLYKYISNAMVQQETTGNIVNNTLQIASGSITTITKTVVDYYCYYFAWSPTYQNIYRPATGYVYTKNNSNGTILYSTQNFTQTSNASALSVAKVDLYAGLTTNPTYVPVTGHLPSNGYLTQMGLNGSLRNDGVVIGTLSQRSSNNITHTVEETINTTTTKVYVRVSADDQQVNVPSSGLEMRLTPISELNATYINSDDPSVEEQVRGLAINTWQGRLFVGGNDGTLYYSEVGLIHGWDLKHGAGAIPMFYNDNSDFSALGLYGQYLVIHRKDYTYYLTPGDGTPDTWQLVPFADLSCDSQQSWLSIGNAYYVYSRIHQGVYPLMRRTIFIDNYLGQELSQKITDEFERLNSSAYDKIFPVYEPLKNYIMFYMPMLQGKGSNYCYCYDTITKSWWLRLVPQNVTTAFRFDNKVYIGTADGKILEEFKGITFDGEPIKFSYRTPWFSFGDGTNYLSTREFRVKFDSEHTNHFQVRNRRDGGETYKSRLVTDNKGPIDALFWDIGMTYTSEGDLDDATLTDTVWDEFEWVDSNHIVKRFPLPDQFFQTEQIEFYGDSLEDGIAIYGFELDRAELEEVPW